MNIQGLLLHVHFHLSFSPYEYSQCSHTHLAHLVVHARTLWWGEWRTPLSRNYWTSTFRIPTSSIALKCFLQKENNFLPHVPPPLLYHLPTYTPYHMSSIVSTIMGVLLLQVMHLCLSREPTSWTLCAINPHLHAPWFASWTCHKIFPQFL